MESQAQVPAPLSRRERREAEQGTSRPRRQVEQTPHRHRWVPRAAVLGTLAVATIAMPLSAGAEEGPGVASPYEPEAVSGPSALDVIATRAESAQISATVAAAPDAGARVAAASRSADRGPLPGCDPDAETVGTNGQLDPHSLCELWQPGESLRPDAAVSLSALNEAFRGRFGRDMCLVSSYRTLSSQAGLVATRGGFAASPGSSMHGWGLAVDLCSKETGSKEVYSWIIKNASTYGWANPKWAQRGGGGAYEPWHFEFTEGVEEVGGD